VTTKPAEILCIDVESASHADISVGNAAYAQHPTTRALCCGFTLQLVVAGELCLREWLWTPGQSIPLEVQEWTAARRPVLAHNVAMEIEMVKAGHIPIELPSMELWHDSMAMAAASNLPQGLDGLAAALGAGVKKDKEGHALMKRLCVLHEDGRHKNPPKPGEIERLGAYCLTDNRAELACYNGLPAMTAAERETWVVDARMNERGVHLDLSFIGQLAKAADYQKRRMLADSWALPKSADLDPLSYTPDTVAKPYLKSRGVNLPQRKRAGGKLSESLDAAACEELLERVAELPADVVEVLKRKMEWGKLTSLSKLKSATAMLSLDHRIRWQLRFCGASQTGRWSAKGLQLHNAPKDRRSAAHTALVRELVRSESYKLLRYCEPNVLRALSQCLRSMVMAGPGEDLIGADYAAIEARVLPWLAYDDRKLQVFRDGVDIYVQSARAVGSTVRNLGKVQELALQFGMGPIKFRDTAASYGVDLELLEARRITRLWRDRNPCTVDFWRHIEEESRVLVAGKPGRSTRVGRCILRRTADRLAIELPSGRMLSYWHPRVVPMVKKFPFVNDSGKVENGEMEVDAIQFWGPRGKGMTLKDTYGGKLSENVTQAAARDLLAHALVVVDHHPVYTPALHLHDAACARVRSGTGSPEEFCQLLTDLPAWAEGLPVDAEGYRSPVFLG